jgi:hypothetical protein
MAATVALLERRREEFDKHPIETPPWVIRSPVSIAKVPFRATSCFRSDGSIPISRETPNAPVPIRRRRG